MFNRRYTPPGERKETTKEETPRNPVALFDLDGTLARKDYNYWDPAPCPDTWCWNRFEDTMYNAPVIKEVADMYRYYEDKFIGMLGARLIVCTARPSYLREMTLAWFDKNKLPIREENLFMMGPHYFEKMENAKHGHASIEEVQAEFKRKVVETLLGQHSEIIVAFDDSTPNVKLFREYNIPTVQVHYE